MGKWKRLTIMLMTAAVFGLLSACGQQSLDATDASGSSPIATGQATMQSEEFASNGETDTSSPSSSASGTETPPELSKEAESPDTSQPDQAKPATTAPTESTPAASAPNGNGTADASPFAPNGNGSPAVSNSSPPGSASSQAPTASASPDSSDAESNTVTLSITGNAEWGTVLDSTEVELNKDDTVRDVLIRTMKSNKLAYETRGTGALFYVTGIDGLFEFDDGPMSGWKYRVNGEVVGVSAGVYKLEPGDRVEWFYTIDGDDD